MITIEKYGAIDIGSNAIRLLITTVIEKEGASPIFKKTSLIRLPIRLGEDVFLTGKISKTNKKRLKDSMRAFSLLLKTHNVVSYRVCATSAMRDAKNGKKIAAYILDKTGLDIHIIKGKEEALIISGTDLNDFISDHENYLYVDVGGGSTEFTFYSKGKRLDSKSFKLGTVRMLNNMIDDAQWDKVEQWIKIRAKNYSKIALIGSGGNINSIYKQSGKTSGKPLTFLYLSSFFNQLNSLTYNERICELNMNSDRADVIIPAMRIYLSAMKWSGARKIYVPKIGLADGIIKDLFLENKAKSKSLL